MGLLDQVIGAAIGSRLGGRTGGGGALSSPLAMALMALLASKAMGSGGGGGLGGMLGGALGGGLGGGAAGGALGGGLGSLIDRFTRNGHGDIAQSWVGPGENRAIAPDQLSDALGPDTVDDLSRQTGMPRGDLLSQLSQILPGVVDQLTPNGRMPQDHETRHW